MSLRPGRLAALSAAMVFGLLLPGSVVLIARAAPAVLPPTFIVNSVGDAVALGPLTDGVCDTVYPYGATHNCTLRAAIMKANNWNWPEGGVTIRFATALNGRPISLTIQPQGTDDDASGDLNINLNTHLIGNGAGLTIIDAAAANDRVFSIHVGRAVDMSGLTIQHGSAAAFAGGGIYNGGQLALDHTAILSNTTVNHHEGGGLYTEGTALTVTNSLVQGNQADDYGGGGLYAEAGVITLSDSTLSGNRALGLYGDGGGLTDSGAALTIARSTVVSNTATGNGGGLAVENGHTDVVNSTFSGNSAVHDGGGLLVTGSSASATLYNATVADNQADLNVTGAGKGGGVAVYNLAGPLTMLNSLIADNSASIDLGGGNWVLFRDDCLGAPVSGGYNLLTFLSTPDIHTCTFTPGVGDVVTTTVNLGRLQNNGGPTFTQALGPGSAAIDAGNTGGCNGPAAVRLATDQRGDPRTANGAGAARCDIGAFEVQRIVDLPLVRR